MTTTDCPPNCGKPPPHPAPRWGWSPCTLPYLHDGMCVFSPPTEPSGPPTETFPSLFATLYPLLVRRARSVGYALALHGSLARDMDLVAIPWTDDAESAEALVAALRDQCDGFIVEHPDAAEKNPTPKPHGRLSWAIHLVGSGAYLDLSVMPRKEPDHDDD